LKSLVAEGAHNLYANDMKKKTIVLLVENPFTSRDYDRFGVEVFLSRGYAVEVWQVTPITKPHGHRRFGFQPVCDFHYLLADTQEFESRLRDVDVAVVLCLVAYGLWSYSLFRIFTKLDVPYCTMGHFWPFQLSMRHRLSMILRRLKARNIADWLFRRLRPQRVGIPGASMSLLLGGRLAAPLAPVSSRTKKIRAHVLDYDIYLRARQNVDPNFKNTAVFLDVYEPFHPDWVNMGVKPIDPAPYYEALDKFFTSFEMSTGLEVVIAEHPRADYAAHGDVYRGRKMYKGKTVELVAACKVVLTHMSTAVNYAVMFKKPIVFITTDAVNRLQGVQIKQFASILKQDVFNMDDELWDASRSYGFDENAYVKYFSDYIKNPETPDLNSWEIYVDALQRFQKHT
jgi:hypothetical protein